MLDNDGYFVIRHDDALIALAIGMCLVATIASVTLFAHARRSEGRARALWLVAAALAGGTGMWTTHFFSMMAFVTDLASGYDVLLMGVAFVAAFVGTGAGLALAARAKSGPWALAGGALVGAAAALTHACGMAAYSVAGAFEVNRAVVGASVLVGIVLAAEGVRMARGPRLRHKLAATACLTAATCLPVFLPLGTASIMLDLAAEVPAKDLSPGRLFLPVSLASSLILLAAGVALVLDVRARRAAAAEAQRMRALADAAVEGLVIADGEWIVTANSSFAALTGFDRDELAGVSLARCLVDPPVVEVLLAGPDRPLETTLAAKGGEIIPVEMVPHSIVFAGRRHLAVAVRDLSARKQAEERIRFLAHHDALTDLPNRALFEVRLEDALQSARLRGRSLAVLCLDLDRLKEVNDLLGHSAGDAALRTAGRVLTETLQGLGTAARLGGDEFAAILPDAGAGAAMTVATAILRGLAEHDGPYASGPRVATSIGIALFPDDGDDRQSLLAAADTALDRAKADGRGTVRAFDAAMGATVRDRRRLEHDLRCAAGRGEMSLVYQPQFAVRTGALVGFEALLRWSHPERGFVSPGLFIPVAEESGAIIAIGEWVMRSACREAATWDTPLRVAVNVSAVQLHAPGFGAFVAGVLAETGIAPGRVELEITETALVRDIDCALATLRKLKALGIKIAMDDFGTGYSSLSNLRAFPFDRIKIDGSFIQSVDSNTQAAAIVRAILELGRGLGLPILAEGVETDAELRFLGAELCHEVQGYLLGRPAAIESFAVATRPHAFSVHPASAAA